MSISQRQHIRFSLDIPARIITKFGELQETALQQISIGGCFTGWEENIYIGEEFRMEIMLPNGNYLPLDCKALYRFEYTGIGVKFIGITQFEQELVSRIITARLHAEGVPLQIDAFHKPATFANDNEPPRVTDIRHKTDSILEKIMTSDI
jgi:hypothetical protein